MLALSKHSRHGLTLITVLVFLGLSQSLSGQTRYPYEGANFTFADPPYTTGNRISGFFEVAVPLPPFLPATNISNLLTDFSFNDGQQTRTPSNTVLCNFVIETDGAGHIANWRLSLRQTGVAEGSPMAVMDSGKSGDQAGSGPAEASACDTLSLTTFAFNSTPGLWSDNLPPGSPTTYTFTGNLFSIADPPYDNSQRLTGWFRVSNPLPGFLPSQELRHVLEDFSFEDGIQTRHPGNTEICSFEITTDGAGHVSHWEISLREQPSSMGTPQQTLNSSNDGDTVGSGPGGSFPCDEVNLDVSASTTNPGQWTDPLPPGNPTDYEYVGTPFNEVLPPYLTSDRVEGFLRFANPLPAYLAGLDLSFALEDFEFQDGHQVRNPDNSHICNFELVTDANGQLLSWTLSLRETPFTSGNRQEVLDISSSGDLGGSGAANMDICGDVTLDSYGQIIMSGLWTDPLPDPEPAVYFYLGPDFAVADPPYQVGQRMGGRMALPGPLPPNMPLTDISNHLLAFLFEDPLQKRCLASSSLCTFEVSTDSEGNIVQWQVFLREPIFTMGDDQESLTTTNVGLASSDFAGRGEAGPLSCSRITLDIRAAASEPGFWFRFCPAQLAALPEWPSPSDVLGLLAISCP